MVDEVLINKKSTIGRCVTRAIEEYAKDPLTFAADVTRQEAGILNVVRACEAALDMGFYLIRRERLGVPQSRRDVFELLYRAGWAEKTSLQNLKNMVGFSNISLHDYQELQLPITIEIITQHLSSFLEFSDFLLCKDAEL